MALDYSSTSPVSGLSCSGSVQEFGSVREMTPGGFRLSTHCVFRQWLHVQTSVPEGSDNFPHFLRESGRCLRWLRSEIWIFHVLLVFDSLLFCVSVSPEEYRNNGVYLLMIERLGTPFVRETKSEDVTVNDCEHHLSVRQESDSTRSSMSTVFFGAPVHLLYLRLWTLRGHTASDTPMFLALGG